MIQVYVLAIKEKTCGRREGDMSGEEMAKISDVERNEDRGRGKKWSIFKRKRPA